MDLQKLARAKVAIDRAIVNVVEEFLRNPAQFHGDTGISHYLYHRIHVQAGELIYSTDDVEVPKTLLLQSEDHTKTLYRGQGRNDSPGRLDFTYIDESTLVKSMIVANHADALIAIEVGLDKGPDKAVGSVIAEATASSIEPADAVKVIRELRFGKLQYGYVLEFYRSDEAETAWSVLQRLSTDLRGLSAVPELRGFTFVLVVAGEDEQDPAVSSWPASWKQTSLLDGKYPAVSLAQFRPATGGCATFLQSAGPCNKLLHKELHRLMAEHPAGRQTVCRRKNMSIGRDYRIKVSNCKDRPERIYDMEPTVEGALLSMGLTVERSQICLPKDEDQEFVTKVIAAVKQVMEGLAGKEKKEKRAQGRKRGRSSFL